MPERDPRGRIRVYGKNMLAGPMFASSEAKTLVMDDDYGQPCVIISRLDDNTWVMGTKADKDWEAVKARFGVG